jgi:hypothetical protein
MGWKAIVKKYMFRPKCPAPGVYGVVMKEPGALLLCFSAFHFCKSLGIFQAMLGYHAVVTQMSGLCSCWCVGL